MKEHPILFSSEMVRAILDGRKTQTRRVIKPQPRWEPPFEVEHGYWDWDNARFNRDEVGDIWNYSPYGRACDRLWVRETWAASPFLNKYAPRELPTTSHVVYRSDSINESHFVWRPSIHMPRWASRITLEIFGVRVERVQNISDLAILDEGVGEKHLTGILANRKAFQELWNKLNEKRGFGWDKNPWVWVVEFKRVSP